jgi:chemotaxis protein methyltransferase CheR
MIPEHHLQELRTMVAMQLGWDFPANRSNDLERGILATAKELGITETPKAIHSWLAGMSWNKKELDILSSHLTVGETYFFREKAGLDVFKQRIIPEIIRERIGSDQYFRLWCAGCCTGEEPYTLAIILHELIPDIRNWKISILATDINRTFLKKAQTGIYSQWSFRETPQAAKNRYFSTVGKDWEIIPEIKKMVSFSYLNLAEDQYPSTLTNTHNLDVIFCRNVLMYFIPQQIRTTAQRFYQSLSDNGWLITSAVEMHDDYFSDFSGVRCEQGTFYRKVSKTTGIPNAADLDPRIRFIPQRSKPVTNRKGKVAPSPGYKPIAVKSLEKTGDQLLPDLKTVQDHFDKGRYQLCIEQSIHLLAVKPLATKALTLLVQSFANMGNLTEARMWGEKLLLQNDITADAYYLVATILMEENEPLKAESTLKRALYLDPQHLLSHFLMGNIVRQLGKNVVAAKHFRNVKDLLAPFQDNEVVPGSEGLTAGRMKSIIETIL